MPVLISFLDESHSRELRQWKRSMRYSHYCFLINVGFSCMKTNSHLVTLRMKIGQFTLSSLGKFPISCESCFWLCNLFVVVYHIIFSCDWFSNCMCESMLVFFGAKTLRTYDGLHFISKLQVSYVEKSARILGIPTFWTTSKVLLVMTNLISYLRCC